MKRQYTSMEAELRALKARGETGMSHGFEYDSRKRYGGWGNANTPDETVSTWSLGDKRERNAGLAPSANRRTGASVPASWQSGASTRTAGSGMRSQVPASGMRPAASGSGLRPVSSSAGVRPSGRARKKKSGSLLVTIIILTMLITMLPTIFAVFNTYIHRRPLVETPPVEDPPIETYDYDPIYNDLNYRLFFDAGESHADPEEVESYAFYFSLFDLYDESFPDLPGGLSWYEGSANGKFIIAFTFWSDDHEGDLADFKEKAIACIAEIEPKVRADLDAKFGEGTVPLALTLYDYHTNSTVYMWVDGEVLLSD